MSIRVHRTEHAHHASEAGERAEAREHRQILGLEKRVNTLQAEVNRLQASAPAASSTPSAGAGPIDVNEIGGSLGGQAGSVFNQIQSLLTTGNLADPATQAKLQALDLQLQGIEQCMSQFYAASSSLMKSEQDTASNTIRDAAV